jgi:gamma-glutamyltranspeptidase/glutathione hydrolase
MRDLQLPGRSVVHAVNGMAATSHPMATAAAVDLLRRGGNAVDAAVAACAVQCVVEPMSTGIGGDCFVLYAPGGGPDVIGLNGSGRAPAGLSADYLLDQGIKGIDLQSPHAVTIPGAVDAWARLVADHGTKGMDEILAYAIDYAENGFAITPRVSVDWARNVPKLEADENAKRQYLPGGQSPVAGSRHASPELAATLKAIAAQGRDGFYTGAVAEDMVAYLRAQGGTHTLEDFANARCDYVDPISTSYGGSDVVQIPPNGQGITALLMLNILSGFDLKSLDPLGVERFHLEAEASRLAYQMRDLYVADPTQAEVPVDKLLSKDFADELRAKIDPKKAMGPLESASGPDYRDTVYLTVVDRDRNAVSFINSLYFPFGSGLTSPKSGVIFQNRGAGFVVEPGHRNCVAPNKRPMHTIIPGMVMRDGKAQMSYGVMGGGYQPVGHVHVIANVFDYGMDVQEAIDCARAFHVSGRLDVERGIAPEVVAGLQALGHEVAAPEMPWGGGQAITIDWQNGTLAGGSDPRKDGCALGY